MNLAFHLMAVVFLVGLCWAWLKERRKNQLLGDLRLQSALAHRGLKPVKVYVRQPLDLIEEMAAALDIPLHWKGSQTPPKTAQLSYSKIQRIRPFSLFTALVTSPVREIHFEEIPGSQAHTQENLSNQPPKPKTARVDTPSEAINLPPRLRCTLVLLGPAAPSQREQGPLESPVTDHQGLHFLSFDSDPLKGSFGPDIVFTHTFLSEETPREG